MTARLLATAARRTRPGGDAPVHVVSPGAAPAAPVPEVRA